MMSEDQLRLEYNALKAGNHASKLCTRYQSVGAKKDFQSLMEKIGELTPLKEAIKFSNKVGQMATGCSIATELLKEVNQDLVLNRDTLRQLQVLRKQDENFLALLEGCLRPADGSQAQFNKFRMDWQRLKRRVEKVRYYDADLARETELIECLYRIFYYYYRTMTEPVYKKTKELLLSMVKKWEAEDLISEQATMQSVVSNFLTRGKNSRLEKDVASNDDVATNHSSDQKVIKSTIISSFIRKRVPRTNPFESEASQTGQIRYQMLSEEGELIGTRLPFAAKTQLATQLEQAPVSTKGLLHRRSLDLQRASTAHSSMLVDTDFESSFVGWLEAKSSRQSRLEHNEISVASLFDRARKVTIQKLTEAIARHCHGKLARCYANKLEAEIFSQHFSTLKDYEQGSCKVVTDLRSVLAREGMTDRLMSTTFDYHEITKVAEKLQEASQESNTPCLESRLSSSENSSTSSAINLDAEPIKRLSVEQLEPFTSDDLSLMEESNSQLLREFTRVKELEILELQQVIEKLEAENCTLRGTLARVRSCLSNS